MLLCHQTNLMWFINQNSCQAGKGQSQSWKRNLSDTKLSGDHRLFLPLTKAHHNQSRCRQYDCFIIFVKPCQTIKITILPKWNINKSPKEKIQTSFPLSPRLSIWNEANNRSPIVKITSLKWINKYSYCKQTNYYYYII